MDQVYQQDLSQESPRPGGPFLIQMLFREPTEGEGRLDLICNTISLETQEVQSRVYHPISLIQLDYLPEGPVREMLSAYAVLQERLGDLGLISA